MVPVIGTGAPICTDLLRTLAVSADLWSIVGILAGWSHSPRESPPLRGASCLAYVQLTKPPVATE